MKRDKGVAGLTMLLTVVVMLFLAGFLVFIYALIGGETADASKDETTTTYFNETLATVTETGEYPIGAQHPFSEAACTILSIYPENETFEIVAANYTNNPGCLISFTVGVDDAIINNSNWNISYISVAQTAGSEFASINGSVDELNELTDWFGIIIVITAMVILILLTVIIIGAIRGTGLVTLGGGAPTETA